MRTTSAPAGAEDARARTSPCASGASPADAPEARMTANGADFAAANDFPASGAGGPAASATDALVRRYLASRDAALRERIVADNLYIAQIIARRFSGRGVEYDDLYQVASLALFKAIDRFDPGKGVKFVSFVTPTMVGEVKNYFRDRSRAIRMPRRRAEMARSVRAAQARLEQRLGRSPRVDELAQALGTSEDDVVEALELSRALTPASLDAQAGEEGEGSPLGRLLGGDDPAFAAFERGDMLSRALEALDARQREVIRARFYEDLSQREVARRLNVSQMTVSRIERQALKRMRGAMDENGTTTGERP